MILPLPQSDLLTPGLILWLAVPMPDLLSSNPVLRLPMPLSGILSSFISLLQCFLTMPFSHVF